LVTPEDYTNPWKALERVGIALVCDRPGARPQDLATDRDGLFLDHKSVRRFLLKGTQWEDQSIDQILRRLPGARKCQRRMGGHRPYGVVVPWVLLTEKYLQSESEGGGNGF
jgi:hypothetical protein